MPFVLGVLSQSFRGLGARQVVLLVPHLGGWRRLVGPAQGLAFVVVGVGDGAFGSRVAQRPVIAVAGIKGRL